VQKTNKHLLISLIILLPASLYLENSDGLDMIDDFYGLMSNWFGAIIVSLIIGTISWGGYFLFNKKSSFVKALYKSCYFVTFICFAGYWIGYIAGTLFG
jgi:hypothetical protein